MSKGRDIRQKRTLSKLRSISPELNQNGLIHEIVKKNKYQAFAGKDGA